MSEQQQPESRQKGQSNSKVLLFIAVLSFICALILSILASALQEPQEIAKELDRIQQMMIAANMMSHKGNFLIHNPRGELQFAKSAGDGILALAESPHRASDREILEVYKKRFEPLLVDSKGHAFTFEQAGIDMKKYLAEYRKSGYYRQPLKLIYKILPNHPDPNGKQAMGYAIPVNGYGLWDAIYGYLALKPDGNTVIGISWYDQKETPGLGANIAEAPWQNHFPGKKIFQETPGGITNFKRAPIGITVVKGKVSEILGDSPKAKSAVDGMPGATLTGNGVSAAYRDVLSAYRPFFIKLHETYERQGKEAYE